MSCFWSLFVQVIATTSPEETATVPALVATYEEYNREGGPDGATDGAMALATSTPRLSKANSKTSLTDHVDLEPAQDNTVVTTQDNTVVTAQNNTVATTRSQYVSFRSFCSDFFLLFL